MNAMHKRLSVPLSEQDVADLAMLRSAPEAARAAGIDDAEVSDAALVHALLRAQLDLASDRAQEAGYARLAADAEWQSRSAAVRSRRRGGDD